MSDMSSAGGHLRIVAISSIKGISTSIKRHPNEGLVFFAKQGNIEHCSLGLVSLFKTRTCRKALSQSPPIQPGVRENGRTMDCSGREETHGRL